jgi:hypothetical protein
LLTRQSSESFSSLLIAANSFFVKMAFLLVSLVRSVSSLLSLRDCSLVVEKTT